MGDAPKAQRSFGASGAGSISVYQNMGSPEKGFCLHRSERSCGGHPNAGSTFRGCPSNRGGEAARPGEAPRAARYGNRATPVSSPFPLALD